MKLLIVDDIAINRKLLRVTLEAEGHTTLEAGDGVEALRVLASRDADAVISDILMPNMDGFRLCLEIRKSEKLHALPFIIYTATYTSPEDVKLAQSIGADKYLTKPASTEAVLQALHEAVGKNRPGPPIPAAQPEETCVLKQYSEALVNKLQEKNADLQRAITALQHAHTRIVELNAGLEKRVCERTSELTKANEALLAENTERRRAEDALRESEGEIHSVGGPAPPASPG
jgi:CheY-like chemotaxis protein